MSDPHETLRADPGLAPLVAEHGPLAVEPADDFFERFVSSVVSQQVSTASAAATRERLHEVVDVTPAGVLAADPETLREAGLSAAKVGYVRNVATAFEEGLSRASLADLDDEAVVERLTDIDGVGPWTAKMQLVFSLGREDVFPVEDLGIRKGMAQVYGVEERSAMVERAEAWRPYRSYASRYLWRAVD